MSRFAPYFGIAVAGILGASIAVFYNTVIPVINTAPAAMVTIPVILPVPNQVATTSIVIEEGDSSLLGGSVSSEPIQIVSEIHEAPTVSEATVSAPAIETRVSVPELSVSEQNAALDASASALRSALVNIVCYVSAGSGLHSISGSGIFVDPKGIIITNAHIAQYLLLTSRNVSCTIRTGSPAADTYKAELAYISPSWIKANAKVLTEISPSGTGEYDFAFLAVIRSATNVPLPDSFPFVPPATAPPAKDTPVAIASYGAQFLEAGQIRSFLSPTVVFGSVKDIFTFASTTVDVLALGGSAAAQEGSSGGGVASMNGELVGVITTSTTKGETINRSLNAITTSYIRAAYATETGSTIDSLFAKPLSVLVSDFTAQAQELSSILFKNLP